MGVRFRQNFLSRLLGGEVAVIDFLSNGLFLSRLLGGEVTAVRLASLLQFLSRLLGGEERSTQAEPPN